MTLASPSRASHIVLIHGAWQGSWAFAAWLPYLQQAGWHVHTVDLPGNGHSTSTQPPTLEGYTAHVVQLLRSLDGPAVVAGHSGGGLTASQVAEAAPECVRALVYLAGMMLPSGWALEDIIEDCAQHDPHFRYTGVLPALQWDASGTHSRVPAETALALFVHDCAPSAAAAAVAQLTAQPDTGRSMRNHLSAARFGRVPRVYVECVDDRSITLPLQRSMQRHTPGAYRISLPCGHVPQLACPEALTRALLPALAHIGAAPLSPTVAH